MTTIETPLSAPPTKPGVAQGRGVRPYLTIRPAGRWVGINFREMWRFRDLLITLMERDVKLRYKQTALGVVWVLLQPLIGAIVFARVMSGMAGMTGEKGYTGQPIPYVVYVFAPLVLWNLFSNILSRVYAILINNTGLVSKVYFPRLLLPLSAALGMLVDLGVSLVVLAIFMVFYHLPVGLNLLASPLLVVCMLALAAGVSMWAAAVCVQYRDVAYVVPVILPFLMFVGPVIYPEAQAAQGKFGAIYYFDPLAGIISAWKWSIFGTPFPPMWAFLYAVGASFVALLLGMLYFRRKEKDFADVI